MDSDISTIVSRFSPLNPPGSPVSMVSVDQMVVRSPTSYDPPVVQVEISPVADHLATLNPRESQVSRLSSVQLSPMDTYSVYPLCRHRTHRSHRLIISIVSTRLHLLCEKLENQIGRKFLSWKHKEPAWEGLEAKADILRKMCLHRKIKGEDLFAREARYHKTCSNHFNTEYHNHTIKMANDGSTDQAQKAQAHSSAYMLANNYYGTYTGRKTCDWSSIFTPDLWGTTGSKWFSQPMLSGR